MSKGALVLRSKADREKACRWIWSLPDLSRITFDKPKRSVDQNSALWPLLTEIAEQRPTHHGVKMTPDLWKSVFLQALGAQIVMIPNLDGDGFFPLGHRSSELSREDFSQLLDFIHAWAAHEGLTISGK